MTSPATGGASNASRFTGSKHRGDANRVHALGRLARRILQRSGTVDHGVGAAQQRLPIVTASRCGNIECRLRGGCEALWLRMAAYRNHLVTVCRQPRHRGRSNETRSTEHDDSHGLSGRLRPPRSRVIAIE